MLKGGFIHDDQLCVSLTTRQSHLACWNSASSTASLLLEAIHIGFTFGAAQRSAAQHQLEHHVRSHNTKGAGLVRVLSPIYHDGIPVFS